MNARAHVASTLTACPSFLQLAPRLVYFPQWTMRLLPSDVAARGAKDGG